MFLGEELGELYARIVGLSLPAVFSVCLILNDISSQAGCASHAARAGFGTISADLGVFTQAHTPVAVKSASYFRRSANESLPECAARSARGEEPGY
jgi:hypothetical protein